MAITPTTMTCAKMSEKFWVLKKRSLWLAKNTQANTSAISGPKVPMGGSLSLKEFIR